MLITSYEDLIEWVKKNENKYYFRCYSQEIELISTLGRPHHCTKETYVDYEFEIIKEFAMKMAEIFPKVTFSKTIELGQHFGLPTRFIDFTVDPYVALFFGLGKENRSTFSLCYTNEENENISKDLKILDNVLSDISEFTIENISNLTIDQVCNLKKDTLLSKDYLCSKKFQDDYKNFFNIQQDYALVPYDPDEKSNLRIMAQKGLFIAMKNPTSPLAKEIFSEIKVELCDKDVHRLRSLLENNKYTPDELFENKIDNFDVANFAQTVLNPYVRLIGLY